MPAPKGNQFAAKAESEKRKESLYIRVNSREKAMCLSAAGDQKTSEWARRVLLEAAAAEEAKKG